MSQQVTQRDGFGRAGGYDMDLYQIDDDGRLFISPALDCWDAPAARGISQLEALGYTVTLTQAA